MVGKLPINVWSIVFQYGVNKQNKPCRIKISCLDLPFYYVVLQIIFFVRASARDSSTESSIKPRHNVNQESIYQAIVQYKPRTGIIFDNLILLFSAYHGQQGLLNAQSFIIVIHVVILRTALGSITEYEWGPPPPIWYFT